MAPVDGRGADSSGFGLSPVPFIPPASFRSVSQVKRYFRRRLDFRSNFAMMFIVNTRDLQVEEAGWTEDLEAWTARLRLPPVVHPKVPASEAGACDPSAGRAGADEPDASCASANKAGANGPTPREPSASKTSAIQTVPCEPRATEAVVSGSVPDPDADPDDGGAPIGPVQSLIVGRVATPETVDAWLALARRVTVRELREEVLKAREAGSSAPLLSGCAAPAARRGETWRSITSTTALGEGRTNRATSSLSAGSIIRRASTAACCAVGARLRSEFSGGSESKGRGGTSGTSVGCMAAPVRASPRHAESALAHRRRRTLAAVPVLAGHDRQS
jgi:hypothetical protein